MNGRGPHVAPPRISHAHHAIDVTSATMKQCTAILCVLLALAGARSIVLRALPKCCVYHARRCCPGYALCGKRRSGARWEFRYFCVNNDGRAADCRKWVSAAVLVETVTPVYCLRYRCTSLQTMPKRMCELKGTLVMRVRKQVIYPLHLAQQPSRSSPAVPDTRTHMPRFRDVPHAALAKAQLAR